MDVDAIPRAIEEAKNRVNVEVMAPLMEWMEAYKVLTVCARFDMLKREYQQAKSRPGQRVACSDNPENNPVSSNTRQPFR
eukprot:1161576-Pelagomonas_calceolata.AAC.4